jgi:hypothetical protein
MGGDCPNTSQCLPASATVCSAPHPVQANRQKRWNDQANTHSPIRPTLKRQIAIARHAEWAQSVPPPPQSPTSPFAAQNKTKKRKKKRKSQVRAIISWDGTHIKQAVSYLWISITCEEPLQSRIIFGEIDRLSDSKIDTLQPLY